MLYVLMSVHLIRNLPIGTALIICALIIILKNILTTCKTLFKNCTCILRCYSLCKEINKNKL